MAAIVTGEGIGLFDSLATGISPSPDTSGSNGRQHAVNVHTGQFIEQYQDKWLVGQGLDTAVLRTYNSDGSLSDRDNNGFYFSFEEWLEVAGVGSATITRVSGDGHRTVFDRDASQSSGTTHVYTSYEGSGAHDTLTHDDTAGTLIWQEGSTQVEHHYELAHTTGQWRLDYRDDGLGNLTHYRYVANSDRVDRIYNDALRGLKITYDTNDHVERIVEGDVDALSDTATFASDGSEIRYYYNADGTLQYVSVDLRPYDASNKYQGRVLSSHYTYETIDGVKRVTEIRQSNSVEGRNSLTQLTYDTSGRVKSIKTGGDYDLISTGQEQITEFVYGVDQTTVRYLNADGTSNDYVIAMDSEGRVQSTTTPTTNGAALTTTFSYDSASNLISQVDNDGHSQHYAYSPQGNLLQQWNALGELTTYTYNTDNQLTSTSIYLDAQNLANVVNGQFTTFTGASRTTYHVYNTITGQLRYVVEPDGTVTEHRYGLGGIHRSIPRETLVYLDERWDTSNEPTRVALDAWQNDFPVSVSRVHYTLRERNPLGQIVTETLYSEAAVNGLHNATGAQTTTYTYDPKTGALLQRIEADDTQTVYTVNAQGQTIKTVLQGDSTTATRTLSDSSGFTFNTKRKYGAYGGAYTADGGWVGNVYDTSGRLMRSYEALDQGDTYFYRAFTTETNDPEGLFKLPLADTRYTYDKQGRLRAEQEQPRQPTLYFYDEQGRRTGQLSSEGVLTEWVYGTAGQLVETIVYADAVDMAVLLGSTQHVTVTPGTRFQGSAAHIVDIQHSDWLSEVDDSLTVSVVKSTYLTAGSDDRRTQQVYDAAGRVRFTLTQTDRGTGSGDRYLVAEARYNAAGEVLAEIRYENVYVPSIHGAIDLARAEAYAADAAQASDLDNRVTAYRYDAQGRLARVLDAEGYLTTYGYSALDQVIRENRYAIALASIDAVVVPDAEDQHQYTLHDDAGRQVGRIDAEGYLTQWTYRNDGLVESETRYEHRLVSSSYSGLNDDDLSVLRLSALQITTDALGNGAQLLSAVTTDNQQSIKYGYNVRNERVWALDHSGVFTEYAYTKGRLTATYHGRVDTNGDTALDGGDSVAARRLLNATTYDVLGRVKSEQTGLSAAAGESREFFYDAAGLMVRSEDTKGNSTYYYYDHQGRERFRVNALGEVTEVVYNAFGEIIETVDYAQALTLSSNNLPLLSNQLLTGGLLNTALITGLSGVATNDTVDRRTTNSYDINGSLSSYKSASRHAQSNANTAASTASFFYNSWGELSTLTERYGVGGERQTASTYSRRGELEQQTLSGGTSPITTVNQYDAFGRTTSITNANGQVTTYDYDNNGRVLQVTDPTTASTHTTYDGYGRVLTQTDGSGSITTYTYDDVLRTLTTETQITDGTGSTTVLQQIQNITHFNEHGEVERVEVLDALTPGTYTQVSEYSYDANGNVTATRTYEADGTTLLSEATASYDTRNLRFSATDANGTVTAYSYDPLGRVTTVLVDDGGLSLSSTNEYDQANRRLITTDANGTITHTDYDPQGRVIKVTEAVGELNLTTSYTYAEEGTQPLSMTRGTQVTQYTYDAYGRRTLEQVDPSDLDIQTAYSYDAQGNVVIRTDGNQNTTYFVYSKRDEQRYTIDALGHVTETRYDEKGQVEYRLTYADSISDVLTPWLAANTGDVPDEAQLQSWLTGATVLSQTQTEYDEAGRVQITTNPMGVTTEYRYDAAGRVTAMTQGANQVAAEQSIEHYQYDGAGRRTHTTVDPATVDPGGLNITTESVYDDNGNVTQRIDGNGNSIRYYYDAANRNRFVVDALGAVTESIYDDDGNKIQTVAYATVMTPGADPATTVVADPAKDQVSWFVYDEAGRLTYSVDPLGAVIEYGYDALSRLVETAQWQYSLPAVSGATLAEQYAALTAVLAYEAQFDVPLGESLASGDLSVLPTPTPVYPAVLTDAVTNPLMTEATSRFSFTGTPTLTADGLVVQLLVNESMISWEETDLKIVLYGPDGTYHIFRIPLEDYLASGIIPISREELTAGDYSIDAFLHERNGGHFYTARFKADLTLANPAMLSVESRLGADSGVFEFWDTSTPGQVYTLNSQFNLKAMVDGFYKQGVLLPTAAFMAANPSMVFTDVASGETIPALADGNYQFRLVGRDIEGSDTSELLGHFSVVGNAITVDSYDTVSFIGIRASGTTVRDHLFSDTVNAMQSVALHAVAADGQSFDFSSDFASFLISQEMAKFIDTVSSPDIHSMRSQLPPGAYSLTFEFYADVEQTQLLQTMHINAFEYRTQDNIKTQTVYDTAGRLAYQVDPERYVTESVYDAQGQVVRTIRHHEPLDDGFFYYTLSHYSVMSDLNDDTTPALDQVVDTVRDAAGRIVYEIDGEGYVSEYSYDARGHIINEIRYDQSISRRLLISPPDLEMVRSLLDNKSITTDRWVYANGGSRVTHYSEAGANHEFYVGGQKVYEVSAAGDVTGFEYNGSGQLIHTVHHDTVVTLGADTSLSDVLDALPTVESAGIVSMVYNTLDQVRYEVSTTGVITEYTYDTSDNRIEAFVRDTAITAMRYTSEAEVESDSNFVVGDTGGTRHYVYNSLGTQLWYEISGGGQVTQYKYQPGVFATPRRAVLHHELYTGTDFSLTAVQAAVTNDTGDQLLFDRVIDKDSQQVQFELDAYGYLTEFQYDAQGRKVSAQGYAQPVDLNTLPGVPGGPGKTTTTWLQTTISALSTPSGVIDILTDVGTSDVTLQRTLSLQSLVGAIDFTLLDANGDVVLDTGGNPLGAAATPVTTSSGIDYRWTIPPLSVGADYTLLVNYATANGELLYQSAVAFTYSGVAQSASAVMEKVRASNVRVDYDYDAAGRLTQEEQGNTTTRYGYDARGHQTTIKDPRSIDATNEADYTTTQVFDAANRKTSASNGLGETTTTYYDNNGNIIAVVDANGNTGYYQYDAQNRLRFEIDPTGHVTERQYDAFGNVTQTIRYLNTVTAYGTALSETDVIQRYLQYPIQVVSGTPGGDGLFVSVNSVEDLHAAATYDQANQVLTRTDAESHVETYAYNAQGEVTTYTDQEGYQTVYTYDQKGQQVTETQTITKDAAGNPIETVTTQAQYDAFGNVIAQTEALGEAEGRATLYRYDRNNKRISTVLPGMAVAQQEAVLPLILSADDGDPSLYDSFSFSFLSGFEPYVSSSEFPGNPYTLDFSGLSGFGSSSYMLEHVHSQSGNAGKVIPVGEKSYNSEYHNFTFQGLPDQLVWAADFAPKALWEVFPDGSSVKLGEFVLSTLDINIGRYVHTYSFQPVSRNDVVLTIEDIHPDATEFYIDLWPADDIDAAQKANLYYNDNGEFVGIMTGSLVGDYVFKGVALDVNGKYVQGIEGGFTRALDIGSNGTIQNESLTNLINVSLLEFSDSNVAPEITQTFDVYGNLIFEATGSGYPIHHYYDELNRRVATVDAERYLHEFDYDLAGNMVAERTYEYRLSDAIDLMRDLLHRPTIGNIGYHRLKTFTYDAANRVLSETLHDVGIYEVGEQFNASDQLVTQHEYDRNGNVVRITQPNDNQSYAFYNEKSLLVAEVDGEGAVTQYVYDVFDQLISQTGYADKLDVIDFDSLATRAIDSGFDANGYGWLMSQLVTSGDDRTTTYTYDKNGRMLTQTSLAIGYTDFVNDIATDQSGDIATSYQYDNVGRLIEERDYFSGTRNYTYDGLGRLAQQLGVEYDSLNNLGSVVSVRQGTSYEYDALGRLLVETALGKSGSADDQVDTYQYDHAGNVTQHVNTEGGITNYYYDLNGNLTDIIEERRNAYHDLPPIITEYQYDKRNQLLSTRDAVNFETVQAYNAYGEIIARGKLDNNGSGNAAYEYFEYDNAGRLVKTNQNDGVDRVYLYDANGNVTADITATVDPENPVHGPLSLKDDALDVIAGKPAKDIVVVFDEIDPSIIVASYEDVLNKVEYIYDRKDQLIVTQETENTINPDTVTGYIDSWESVIEYPSIGGKLTAVPTQQLNYELDYRAGSASGGGVYGFYIVHIDRQRFALPSNLGLGGGDWVLRNASGENMRYLGSTTNVPLSNPEPGNPFVSVQHRIVDIYKDTPVGLVHVAHVGDVNFQNSPTTITGYFQAPFGGKLYLTDIDSETASVSLELTPIAGGATSTHQLTRVLSESGAEVPGFFELDITDPLVFPHDDYNYHYTIKDAAGDILDEVMGEITLGNTTTTVDTQFLFTKIPDWMPGASPDYRKIHRQVEYNAFGEVSKEIDGRGYALAHSNSDWAKAERLRLIYAEDVSGLSPSDQAALQAIYSTEFIYDQRGNIVEQLDPETEITLVSGDVALRQVNPSGQTILQPVQTITNDGEKARHRNTTRYYYDEVGRLLGAEDANSTLYANRNDYTRNVYNNNGDIIQEAYADDGVKMYVYDAFGNRVKQTNQVGESTYFEYNDLNQLVKMILPTDATFANYNASDLKNRYETYTYDYQGNRTSRRNPNGNTEYFIYDVEGRLAAHHSSDAPSDNVIVWHNYTFNHQDGGYIKTTTYADGRTLVDHTNYFNRLESHADLEGREFEYLYNDAGHLIEQTGSFGARVYDADGLPTSGGIEDEYDRSGNPVSDGFVDDGQHISYEYYSNGLVKRIIDHAQQTESYYEYDENGNRSAEWYVNALGGLQQSVGTYDELNRLVEVRDEEAGYLVNYQFDANGNRMRVLAQKYNPTTFTDSNGDGVDDGPDASLLQDYWYKYDAMNRFTITKGELDANEIVTGTDGYRIGYNKASQRIAQERLNVSGDVVLREAYSYNAGGLLTHAYVDTDPNATTKTVYEANRQSYDANGNLLSYQERSRQYTSWTWDSASAPGYRWWGSWKGRTSVESATGEVTVSWASPWSNIVSETNVYDANGRVQRNVRDGSIITDNTYDTVGNVVTTETTDPEVDRYSYYAYEYWDTVKQAGIRTDAAIKTYVAAHAWRPGHSSFQYNVNGHLTQVYDREFDNGGGRGLDYLLDSEGRILKRFELSDSATRSQSFYYFNGIGIGDEGDFGTAKNDYATHLRNAAAAKQAEGGSPYQIKAVRSVDFDYNFRPINDSYPSRTPGSYIVQSSQDTANVSLTQGLSSIAAQLWGDASLWYLLADANGLTTGSSITAGERLITPNVVTNIHNNSSTFKPYNPSELQGNVQPTLPDVPPPRPNSGGCGVLGVIVVIIVVIVVTYVTKGAAGSAAINAGGALLTTTAASGAVVLSTTGAVIIGAAAAAVGSIAGQLVGLALGVQDKFSFSDVGLAALGGAITAGLGGIGNLNGAVNPLGQAAQAVARNFISQGINIAIGEQDGFDWRQAAVAGIAAPITSAINDAIDPSVTSVAGQGAIDGKFDWSTAARDVVRETVNAAATEAVKVAVYDSQDYKFDWVSVAGNGIGNGLTSEVSGANKGRYDVRARRQEIQRQKEFVGPPAPDVIVTTTSASGEALAAMESVSGNSKNREQSTDGTLSSSSGDHQVIAPDGRSLAELKAEYNKLTSSGENVSFSYETENGALTSYSLQYGGVEDFYDPSRVSDLPFAQINVAGQNVEEPGAFNLDIGSNYSLEEPNALVLLGAGFVGFKEGIYDKTFAPIGQGIYDELSTGYYQGFDKTFTGGLYNDSIDFLADEFFSISLGEQTSTGQFLQDSYDFAVDFGGFLLDRPAGQYLNDFTSSLNSAYNFASDKASGLLDYFSSTDSVTLSRDLGGLLGQGIGEASLGAVVPPLIGRVAKGAGSIADGAKLNRKLTLDEIVDHSFEKHVLKQGEFAGLGIRTKAQFRAHVDDVLNNPSSIRYYKDGRAAYLQKSTSTVVIRNPTGSGQSTAFQPRDWNNYTNSVLPSRTVPHQ